MGSFDVRLDHDLRVVRVMATGELVRAAGERLITEARMTAAEAGYDILCDARDVAPNVSLAAWFHLPRELEVLKDPKTARLKAAVLIPRGPLVEDYRFYEAVAANVGLQIRMFFDEEDALQWLGRT